MIAEKQWCDGCQNRRPCITRKSGVIYEGKDCEIHLCRWCRGQETRRSANATQPMTKHTYAFKIINGRVKVYVNGYVMFTFNQIDFKGYYSYKDDTLLYGIDIYLMNEKGGATTMEIYFKTKENWLGILRLLDENL